MATPEISSGGALPKATSTIAAAAAAATAVVSADDIKEATKALFAAVREGDAEKVQAALRAGADIQTPLNHEEDQIDGSLLTLAAHKGHVHLVSHLVDAGLHVDARGSSPNTALHLAMYMGHQKFVKALLEKNADVNAKDDVVRTPLHLAAIFNHTACAKALIEAGADLNARDGDQLTPLYITVMLGMTATMKLLLEAGCSHDTGADSASLINVAAAAGNEEAIQRLRMASFNPEDQDELGRAPEDVAEARGQHNTAWLLRKMPRRRRRNIPATPVHTLMSRSQEEYEVEGKETIQNVQEHTISAFWPSNFMHRDVHYQDEDGLTPLHWAGKLGFLKVAELMIRHCGALPTVVTHDGKTPIDLALEAGHKNWVNAVKDMIAPKTWQNVPDILMFKAIREAICCQPGESEPELYRKLLNVISTEDNNLKVSYLLQSGAPLEPVGDFYTSALLLALSSNRPKVLSLLLAAGAPLTTSNSGFSLLQVAWHSPDVTAYVKFILTRHLIHALRVEGRRVQPQDTSLKEGIEHLVKSMESETPWLTRWPVVADTNLTFLMVQAATNNCPLTASFLRQEGAKAFLQDERGTTPLHALLENQKWTHAKLMLKDMGGCLYVPDAMGRMPRDMLPPPHHLEMEKNIYHREKHKLEELLEKSKDKEEKNYMQDVLDVYEALFKAYITKLESETAQTSVAEAVLQEGVLNPSSTLQVKPSALLVSSQRGLLQLTYLLVTMGGLVVNTVVDPTQDSTALHQAASHGNSGCVALLLSLGACPLKRDRYGHTPVHLAAMFGHKSTYQLLLVQEKEIGHQQHQPPVCRAGTTPQQVASHFKNYLNLYLKSEVDPRATQIFQNSSEGIQKYLEDVDIRDIRRQIESITVDFSTGEAKLVKDFVNREVQGIMDKISKVDSMYKGELVFVGSSSDGSRLNAPDEYDISLVLSGVSLDVDIAELKELEARLKGHRLRVQVKTDHPGLQGNKLINNFYELIRSCLEEHVIENSCLSLVPPGVTKTQVGVALMLAWQGHDYPLLLISIDLVPVLAVPWPAGITKPPLTPAHIKQVYLSNTAEGEWRCSFAGAEAEVLAQLDSQERLVYLACKALLAHLKAEPWMPREVKDCYTWWDSRRWKIIIPAGFAMKNSFLQQLQEKQQKGLRWRERHFTRLILAVMRTMCQDMVDPTTAIKSLVPAKIHAYFGGDFETPKFGEGAPEIIKALNAGRKRSKLK